MTSINRIDRALSILRQALAEHSATGQAVLHPDARLVNRTDKSSKQLRERIIPGLAALDLTRTPDQERGVAIFLETVLANEFGAALLSDPVFHNLMADVKKAMFADKNTHRDVVSMLSQLQESTSKNPG